MISNPSEFRQRLHEIFTVSPLTVAGRTFDQSLTDEAIEEVVAAMVRTYMQEGGPSACEQIVGAFFLGLIERNQSEN